jgi:hypothetical protein
VSYQVSENVPYVGWGGYYIAMNWNLTAGIESNFSLSPNIGLYFGPNYTTTTRWQVTVGSTGPLIADQVYATLTYYHDLSVDYPYSISTPTYNLTSGTSFSRNYVLKPSIAAGGGPLYDGVCVYANYVEPNWNAQYNICSGVSLVF